MARADQRGMRALLIAMFASSIPATLLLPMMPSFGTEFDVSPTMLGFLVGIYPLMSMLASPFWGRMSDRYGRKPILIITLQAFVFMMLTIVYMSMASESH